MMYAHPQLLQLVNNTNTLTQTTQLNPPVVIEEEQEPAPHQMKQWEVHDGRWFGICVSAQWVSNVGAASWM